MIAALRWSCGGGAFWIYLFRNRQTPPDFLLHCQPHNTYKNTTQTHQNVHAQSTCGQQILGMVNDRPHPKKMMTSQRENITFLHSMEKDHCCLRDLHEISPPAQIYNYNQSFVDL